MTYRIEHFVGGINTALPSCYQSSSQSLSYILFLFVIILLQYDHLGMTTTHNPQDNKKP